MIYELKVPLTLEDNESVRLLEWHGGPGTHFAAGALIVEVETHKALIEIRGEQSGVLRECRVGEGEWCRLGGVLGVFSDTPDEPVGDGASEWQADFRIG